MASSKEDNNDKPNTSSIEKMTEGFILSGTSNNNNSNDTSTIDTPRSVTSSPEEGDDSKTVCVVDDKLEVDVDSTVDASGNSEVTAGK